MTDEQPSEIEQRTNALTMVMRLIGGEFQNIAQQARLAVSPHCEFGVQILKILYVFGMPHQRHRAWRALKRAGVHFPNPAHHRLMEILDQ